VVTARQERGKSAKISYRIGQFKIKIVRPPGRQKRRFEVFSPTTCQKNRPKFGRRRADRRLVTHVLFLIAVKGTGTAPFGYLII
jgi:hypothetical protein